MKKLLLTIMLVLVSTALLWSTPHSLRGEELIQDASGVTLTRGQGKADVLRHDLKKGAPQGITRHVASQRAKAPAYKLPATRNPQLKFEKDPLATVAKAKAPARIIDENTVWGEWYNFKEGTLSTQSDFVYSALFGLEFPRNVVLQRRDAVGDPTSSQLRFQGFLEDYDFIINYNPQTKIYWWDTFVLDHTENPYGSDTPYFVGRGEDLQLIYSPKAAWKLPLFIVLLENAGFDATVSFESADKPDGSFNASFYTSNAQAGLLNFEISEVGADVAQVRYGMFYTDNGYVYDGENGLVPARTIVDANREDFGVVTLGRDQIAYSTTLTADRSGMWYVYMAIYDADGDMLGSAGGTACVGLSEPEKWKDAGTVQYTDGQLFGVMQNLILNEQEGFCTDLTLPDWAWGPYTWDVALEQNVDNPAIYRLVNPYTCSGAPYYDAVISYTVDGQTFEVPVAFDKTKDYYLIVDLSNPEAGFTYSTPMGIVENGDNYWNYDMTSGVVTGNQVLPAEARTAAGFYYDPKGMIVTNDGNYPFNITFPKYHDYDFSFVNTWTTISLSDMGPSLSKIVYTFCKSGEEPENLWDILAGTGEGLPTGTILASDFAEGHKAVDLTPFNLEYQTRYWLYAMGYDMDGNLTDMKATEFTPYAHEYAFYSEAQMRESTIEETAGDIPSEFYFVDVYTAEDAEGHYFIRNPYANHPYLSSAFIGDVETFMEIDCSNPERVTIPRYKVPLDLGVDNLNIQSTAYYFMSHGQDPDVIAEYGWFGKFDGAQISFPNRGTAWGFTDEEGDKLSYGSNNSTFCVRFPWFIDYTFTLVTEGNDAVVTEFGNTIDHLVFSAAETTETAESDLVNGFYAGTVEYSYYWGLGRLPIEYIPGMTFEVGKTYTVVAISVDAENAFREFRSAEITIDQSFYDFALEVRSDIETEEKYVYLASKGSGVASIGFTVVEKDTMTEEELIAGLRDGSIEPQYLGETGPLPLEYFVIEPGKTYVVAAVALDAMGVYRGSKAVEFKAELPFVFQGTGTYTDAFMQVLFKWDEALEALTQPREVEVYTRGDSKDVAYVKEPFASEILEIMGWNYLGSRYLAVDISDPEKVYIHHAAMGIGIEFEDETWFSSLPAAYMNLGSDPSEIGAECYGTLVGDKVVIPATNLVIKQGDKLYTPGEIHTENLELVLPPLMTGVKDVEATLTPDAPAEYFDLSGRRVAHPAGGIYIVRRGTTVTKEFIR